MNATEAAQQSNNGSSWGSIISSIGGLIPDVISSIKSPSGTSATVQYQAQNNQMNSLIILGLIVFAVYYISKK